MVSGWTIWHRTQFGTGPNLAPDPIWHQECKRPNLAPDFLKANFLVVESWNSVDPAPLVGKKSQVLQKISD